MSDIKVVVSVRGLTGSGKSTVMKVIRKALEKEGFKLSETRFQSTLETVDVTKKNAF